MQNPEDLIRKLLAMAKGGTEHEAALAAERAAGIALKYNIDLLDLQQKDDKPKVGEDSVYNSNKRELWICNLLFGLTLLNSCKFYLAYQKDGSINYRIVGRPINIMVVESTCHYLIEEIKRMGRTSVKRYNFDQEDRSNYRKDFRLTASRKLLQRMHEKHESFKTQTGKALLVINNMLAEIEEHLENIDFKKTRLPSTKLRSIAGIIDGERAGGSISLSDQLNGATNGVRRISS